MGEGPGRGRRGRRETRGRASRGGGGWRSPRGAWEAVEPSWAVEERPPTPRPSYHTLSLALSLPRSGGSSSRKRRPNQVFLMAMLEMGIPKHKAEVALVETGNVGVEVATEWLFSAPDTAQLEHAHAGAARAVAVCARGAGRTGRAARAARSTERSAGGGRPRAGGARGRGAPHCTAFPASSSQIADTGSPSSTSSACSMEDPCMLSPKRVPLRGVRFIAAGAAHTVAVTDEATYSWGAGEPRARATWLV